MRVLAITLLAALPALAQSPANYRSSAEVTPTGPDALHLLELPFEAYRDARRDLGDIRIFNMAGDSLPYAWAPDPGRLTEPAVPIDLPMFPVRKVTPEGQASTEVTVRAADGTLVSVRGAGALARRAAPKAADPKPVALLVDASKTNEPVQAIEFEWQAVPGAEMVTVRVEASDDLRSWTTLGSAPLVRLGGGQRMLLQPRVQFPPRSVKYLRATWDAPAFEPTAVRAEYVARGKAPPRLVSTIEPGKPENNEKADEIVYDLGASLPVEALRLLPPQENAVLVTAIFARDEPTQQWRPMFNTTFYRLQREGVESTSVPRELGRRAARYWMARLAPGSSQGGVPKLEVHWTPGRLVFVKQGEGPFYLAFGNLKAAPTAVPIDSVIPDYKKGAEELLKRAQLGAVKAEPPPNRWEKLIGEMDARRVTLWVVLVAGVAALGAMAWKLSRQVR